MSVQDDKPQSQTTDIAHAICPYLMGLDSGTYDPADPSTLPECRRCEAESHGEPGCLYIARLAAAAVQKVIHD